MKYRLSSIALLLILPLLAFSLMRDFSAQFSSSDTAPVLNEYEKTLSLAENPALSLSAKHAVLMTAEGIIIYGKNEHEKAEMASTTKVMTALLAIEHLEKTSLDKSVTVGKNAVGIEGSSIYLEEGEEVLLLDLVYALLLASANDAAIAIAEAVGGSVEGFVQKMNEKAEALSLDNTHFDNPHGLPSSDHYTTAYSLARLMAKAMENTLFARITATRRYTMKSDGAVRHLVNHNRLLSSLEGVNGGKTGFTKKAGRCLVSSAERDGARLFAVTLSASDDWNDHKTLYTYGFTHWEAVTIPAERYELPLISGISDTVTIESEETTLVLPKVRDALSYFRASPRFVYAPIAKGDTVGHLRVTLSGKTLAVIAMKAENTVKEEKKPSFFEKLFS